MFLLPSRVKIRPQLLDEARQLARQRGYASVNDLISHLLERELRTGETADAARKQSVLEKMKGLGYLQ